MSVYVCGRVRRYLWSCLCIRMPQRVWNGFLFYCVCVRVWVCVVVARGGVCPSWPWKASAVLSVGELKLMLMQREWPWKVQPSYPQSEAFDFHRFGAVPPSFVFNAIFFFPSLFPPSSCNFETLNVSVPIHVSVISLLSLSFVSSVCPPCPVESFPLARSFAGSSWPVCVSVWAVRCWVYCESSLYCSPPIFYKYSPFPLSCRFINHYIFTGLKSSSTSLLLHILPCC